MRLDAAEFQLFACLCQPTIFALKAEFTNDAGIVRILTERILNHGIRVTPFFLNELNSF